MSRVGLRRAAIGLGGVGLSLGLGLPELAPIWSVSRSALGIRDRLPQSSLVALTFDDGPHAEGTTLVLDFLERAGIRATFFLVGEQVVARPQLAAEIAGRGHEIGLHGFHHRTLARLTARELEEDWARAGDAIAAATGRQPLIYRPPRGVFTYGGLRAARHRGWEPVLWAVDGRDWRASATPASVANRITQRLTGGEVILLHDADHYASPGCWRDTLAALPRLVDGLKARELTPVALTPEVLGRPA